MFFADTLTLDAPRRTADGYLAVRARAARTGVYQYTGREVDPDNAHGLRDLASVNVLRDESTVFDERSVRSFIGKPITTNHPSEPVTSKNWKKHADGVVMGAMRDGDHLAFDLLLMDEGAISDTEAGRVQLSNGYGADLEFGDFDGPNGVKCQARQTSISGNHVARVNRGRAGESCRIGDVALCDSIPLPNLKTEKPVKTMLIDGLTVDMANADTAIATVQTLIGARDAATAKVAGLETQVATLTAESQTKDAKITTLEQQVKDAKPTAAQLREAGKALIVAADKAKALGVTVSDEMDEAQIMRATVDKRMGEKAKGWSDESVAASFAVLTEDVKASEQRVTPIGAPVVVGDAASLADAAWEKANDDLNAWRAE